MTTQAMLDLLGFKFRDIEDFAHNTNLTLAILNQAQDRVIQLLYRHLLSELDGVDLDQALTSDSYAISNLTSTPYMGIRGIDYVKINGGKYCRKVSFREYQDHSDGRITFSTNQPVWYNRGGVIYPLPVSTGDTIDIYYMKEPTALTAGNTSDLNAAYHDLIVEIAESEIWAALGKWDFREEALQRAYNKAESFNSKTPQTDMLRENVQYDDLVVSDGVTVE